MEKMASVRARLAIFFAPYVGREGNLVRGGGSSLRHLRVSRMMLRMTEAGLTTERRPWRVREMTAWGLIVFVIAVLLLLLAPLERLEQRRPGVGQAAEGPDLRVVIPGRYIVGMREVFEKAKAAKGAGGAGGAGGVEAGRASDSLRDAMKTAAKTPQDRLELATVRGEIDGKEAALRDIDAVEAADPSLRKDAEYLRTLYTGGPQPAEPEGFHERFGWFGDLAKSFGKPEADPLRAATISAAERTVLFGALGVVVIGLMTLAGLVLLITGIVLWYLGKLPTRFGVARVLPADRAPYVEGFAAYLSIYILGSLVLMLHLLPISTRWGLLLLPLGFGVAVMWPVLCGQTWGEWRATVGLHAGRGFFTELACGAVGYVAGLPLLALGVIATTIIVKMTGADPTHPISREITPDPVRIGLLLLLASVWAPITEELMFRGELFGHLRERWGWWGSALVVSLVFAIIHPQGLAALPVLGSIALVLAAIREWRGSILGCMMAHCINNTVVLMLTVGMIS